MKRRVVTIRNKAGMHARPSSLFVQTVTQFDSEIIVKYEDEEVNGKSIMGLMLLAAEEGRELELVASGSDAEQLLEALYNLIEIKKFNED